MVCQRHPAQDICDALGKKTWFRIETKTEAMRHSLDCRFRHAHEGMSSALRRESYNPFETRIP